MTSIFRRAILAGVLLLAAGCQSTNTARIDTAPVPAEVAATPLSVEKLYDRLSDEERLALSTLLEERTGKAMIGKGTPNHMFWQELARLGWAQPEETDKGLARIGQIYSLTPEGEDRLAALTGQSVVASVTKTAGTINTPCGRAVCSYLDMACKDVFDSTEGRFTLPRREYQRLYLYAMGYFLAISGKRQIPGESMRTNMVLLTKQCASTPQLSLIEALDKTAQVVETRGPVRQKALWPQKRCGAVFGDGEPAYRGKPAEMPYLIELVMGYYSAYTDRQAERIGQLKASKSILPTLVGKCQAEPNLNFADALKATVPWPSAPITQ